MTVNTHKCDYAPYREACADRLCKPCRAKIFGGGAVNVIDTLWYRTRSEYATAERCEDLARLEKWQGPVTWNCLCAFLVGKADRLDITDETRG